MRKFCVTISVFLAVNALLPAQVRANDQRCRVPPYGMSSSDFKRFTEALGHLIVVTQTLPALCNAKYGGADRTGLYNLGFTDQDIDSENMFDLSVHFIDALKKLADKIQ